jgi:trehalose 6-phosphate phosphatase
MTIPAHEMAIDPALRAAIREIARTPHLLVASDYDGTLSPIVENPAAAKPLPESIAALRALAILPSTTTAVVSGRALRDLAALSRLPSEVHLIGSHGSEFDVGFVQELSAEQRELLGRVHEACSTIAGGVPGVALEAKPAGVAVHVRRAARDEASRVLSAVYGGPAAWPGVHVTEGKEVLELSVVRTDKGSALERLRHQVGASAAIFVGDDVTDERAFAVLTGPDVSVKVGDGYTLARHRVEGPAEAALLLALVAEERRAWLTGADATPIEDHALLADGLTTALLTPSGNVTWLCHPDPDSPALFAQLLGDEGAGYFAVHPVREGVPLGQSYVGDTMTVRTRWAGLTVTDYLDRTQFGPDEDGVRVTRLVRVISGRTPARLVFAPRPDFGRVPVRLEQVDGGLKVVGTTGSVVLRAPGAAWDIHADGMHETATALVDPSGGDVVIELRCGTDDLADVDLPEAERRARTENHWRDWAAKLRVPDGSRAEVVRSALTLKALCHESSGGILAAATTSLPEGIGGIRNWDYRYCWVRDAALTARALLDLGSRSESEQFLLWLRGVLEHTSSPEQLHPLYTLSGAPLGPEAVIDTLSGYAGSRPVRVANAAQGQVQLDVFGPVCDLVLGLVEARGTVAPEDLWLLEECVLAVERRWMEPDHGIWEIRDRPRQHVHSKVMCWMTVDRAIRVVELTGTPRDAWVDLRDRIAADVLENGWIESEQSFVAAYDRVEADAATLFVTLSGLLAPDDPRAAATVHAVEADLRSGPVVYRYRYDDGLPGGEGGMLICTSWLVEAYAAAGMIDEAVELNAQVLGLAGLTGLLPEQYDPVQQKGLGNHPQAYSHVGVIRSALAIEAARDRP